MRRESELWIDQAKRDFEVAKKNFKLKEYYIVAFLCQQAVEKALKALFMEKAKESPGTTHSLIFLASKVKLPKKFFTFLQEVSSEFVATRYPDVADEVPYKLYGKEKTNEYVKKTEALLQWILTQL